MLEEEIVKYRAQNVLWILLIGGLLMAAAGHLLRALFSHLAGY